MRLSLLCLFGALACAAQTAVAPPSLGVLHDCEGRPRRVFGTPGAFLIGPPEAAQGSSTLPAPDGVRIEGRALIVRDGTGAEKRIPLTERSAGLQRLAPGWLTALPFLIRLNADGATVYRLPIAACGSQSKEAAR
jgi:hypothetical protein